MRTFPALAVFRVLGLPSSEQSWWAVFETVHSHLGCLCCIMEHSGCVTGIANPLYPASLISDPRCVAQSKDTGHGFSSARTLGPMASEALCSRLHSSLYRNWAPGESGCLSLAFTWNCVIYNYITNSCCRTDALNCLVYEKWLFSFSVGCNEIILIEGNEWLSCLSTLGNSLL